MSRCGRMTAYRFSCWVKTRDLGPVGSFQMLALGTGQPGRQLTFQEGGLEPNQDWKQFEVVFNSLDQQEANLYVGFWGQGNGTLWLDDLALEELSLVNVLRRQGCPLAVKSADGRTTYRGRPRLRAGCRPQARPRPLARANTNSTIRGDDPRLTPRSRIKDGDRLRVSWYHPVITARLPGHVLPERAEARDRSCATRPDGSTTCSIPGPSSCRTTRSAWPTGARRASDRKLTPGQLLADNVRRCTSDPQVRQSQGPCRRLVGHVRPAP